MKQLTSDVLDLVVREAARVGSGLNEPRTWPDDRVGTLRDLLVENDSPCGYLPRGCWKLWDGDLLGFVAWIDNKWWWLEDHREVQRCGFLVEDVKGVPVPRFGVGDRPWRAGTITTTEDTTCPDCLGQRTWSVMSRSVPPTETTIQCPRCEGRGVLKLSTRAAEVLRFKVASVEVRSHGNWSGSRVQYCTGEGGGQIAREWDLFDTEAEALEQAEEFARIEREGLESGPQKSQREQHRELRAYTIEFAQAEAAHRERRRAESDLEALRERVMELTREEYGLYVGGAVEKSEHFKPEWRRATLNEQQRNGAVAWIMSLHDGDEDFWLDWMEEEENRCEC